MLFYMSVFYSYVLSQFINIKNDYIFRLSGFFTPVLIIILPPEFVECLRIKQNIFLEKHDYFVYLFLMDYIIKGDMYHYLSLQNNIYIILKHSSLLLKRFTFSIVSHRQSLLVKQTFYRS